MRRQAADPGVAANQVAGTWLVTPMVTRRSGTVGTPHRVVVTPVTVGAGAAGVGSRLDGQMSSSTQSPHRGDLATQTRRPWRIIRRLNAPRSAGRQVAVELELDLHRVVLRRSGRGAGDSRPTWVSTGQAGQVEGHAAHDVGGLAADAGQRHEVLERGRHLAAEALDERLPPCRAGCFVLFW